MSIILKQRYTCTSLLSRRIGGWYANDNVWLVT